MPTSTALTASLSEAIDGWLGAEPTESTAWEAGPLRLLTGITNSWPQISTRVRVDGPNGPYEHQARSGPNGALVVPMDVSYRIRHPPSPAHWCRGHQTHLQAALWREYAGRWKVVDSLVDEGWQSSRWCLASEPPQTVGSVRAYCVAVGQPSGQSSVAYIRIHNDDHQSLTVSMPTSCNPTVGGSPDNIPGIDRTATIPAGGMLDMDIGLLPVLRGTAPIRVGSAKTPGHQRTSVFVPIWARLTHIGRQGWCACSVAAANLAGDGPSAEPAVPTRVSRRWWGRRRGDGAGRPR